MLLPPNARRVAPLLLLLSGTLGIACGADYYIGVILEPVTNATRPTALVDENGEVPILVDQFLGIPAPVAAFTLAIDEINRRTDILPNSTLLVVHNSSEFSVQQTRVVANWQMNKFEPTPVAFFGTWSYETTKAVAAIASLNTKPHVSSVARADDLSDDTQYPTFVRATAGDSSIASGLVSLCRHFGWQRVAVVHSANAAGSGLMHRLEQVAVQVELEEMDSFPFAVDGETSARIEAMKTTLRRLKASTHKIVILDIEVRFLVEFFAHWYGLGLHEQGYTLLGTEQWTSDFFDLYHTFTQPIKEYTDIILRGILYLSSDRPNKTGNADAHRYEELAGELYGNDTARIENERVFTPTALRTWDSAFLMARAIESLENQRVDPHDGPALLAEILAMDFHGASGPIVFDKAKRQLKISWNIFSWVVHGDGKPSEPAVLVGSYNATNSSILLSTPVIWPDGTTTIPLDRAPVATASIAPTKPVVIELRQTSPQVQFAALFIAAAGTLVVFGHAVGLFMYRKTPIFRAASGSLLWLVLLGALFGMVSIVVVALDYTPDSPVELSRSTIDTLCKVQPFVVGSAFVLTFGVLYATAHRIASIFRVKSAKPGPSASLPVIITDSRLRVIVFGLWLVDQVINFAWLKFGALGLSQQKVSATIAYNSCVAPDERAWLWVSVAYKAALLVMTLYKAVATRNVPAAFNSSSIMAMATYNVVIFSVVSIPLSLFAAENVDFAQPFRLAALGFCSLIIVGMLIGQKIFIACLRPERNQVAGTSSARSAASRGSRAAGASSTSTTVGGTAVELGQQHSSTPGRGAKPSSTSGTFTA